MKKLNVTFLMIAIILVGMTSLCHAYVAYYSLFVVSGDDNPNRIYQLKILPNGQILDTYVQYTAGGNGGSFGTGSLGVSPGYRFLFAASDAVYRFQIQADGSLVSIGSTNPGGVAFTPNEQLVIGWNTIYSLTSTGDLINGTPGPNIGSPKVDPLGRGILAYWYPTFSAYTINYDTRILSLTTTYPLGNGNYYNFVFTPDGKLGFLAGFGVSPNGGDLQALKIDSTFTVTTTQVMSVSQGGIYDMAVSNDSRYLWADTGYYIELFSIDTLGNVTDTGKQYYALNVMHRTGVNFQRNTPDGNLAIVEYDDDDLAPEAGCFATAFINGDGSLTWTGYTFAFDSAHPTEETVVDYAIIPVYATGIPEELWKDPPPELIIHDSQKILN